MKGWNRIQKVNLFCSAKVIARLIAHSLPTHRPLIAHLSPPHCPFTLPIESLKSPCISQPMKNINPREAGRELDRTWTARKCSNISYRVKARLKWETGSVQMAFGSQTNVLYTILSRRSQHYHGPWSTHHCNPQSTTTMPHYIARVFSSVVAK